MVMLFHISFSVCNNWLRTLLMLVHFIIMILMMISMILMIMILIMIPEKRTQLKSIHSKALITMILIIMI